MNVASPAADAARDLVDRVEGLPPLPAIALRLNELLSGPRTPGLEVAHLLGSDPAVAARVLRIANSASHGCWHRIQTLAHAIMVLGFGAVRNVVLAMTLLRSLESAAGFRPDEQRRLWRSAVAAGAAAKVLAARRDHLHVEELFLMGLLHDVGRIVLRAWLPEQSARIDAQVSAGVPRSEGELVCVETTHEEIGAALLERQLPPAYVEVARVHHDPGLARDHRGAAAIVHVADVLASALLFGAVPDEPAPPLSREAWQYVGLTPASLPGVLRDVLDLVAEAEGLPPAAAVALLPPPPPPFRAPRRHRAPPVRGPRDRPGRPH